MVKQLDGRVYHGDEPDMVFMENKTNKKTPPKQHLHIFYSSFSLRVWQRWNAPLTANLVFARLVMQTLKINILAPN